MAFGHGALAHAWEGPPAMAGSGLMDGGGQANGDGAPETDRYLRRTDLLDGDRPPQNPLEWLIVVAADARTHLAAFLLFGLAAVGLGLAGYSTAAGMSMYLTVLGLLVILLFEGWDWLESVFGIESGPPADGGGHLAGLPDHVNVRIGSTDEIGDRSRQRGYGELKITIVLVVLLVLCLAGAALLVEWVR